MGQLQMLEEEHLNQFCIKDTGDPFIPPLTALTDEDDAEN